MVAPTRPDLIFGVNNKHPASVGTSTDSLGTVLYEEQSSGTNGSGVGFGQRLAARHYENYPKDVFTSGQDIVTKFNGGRTIVVSVSGGYPMTEVTAGSHDTEWNNMFDRMLALDFGGTDTSGANTKKPLVAPLCYWHECNVPRHQLDPTQFVAAWKHIRTLRDARALAAGVSASRVPMMTIFTAYGISAGQATPFWPGTDQVDLFGVDGYSGLGGGPWTEPASIFAGPLKFSADRGDKDIWICETSVKEETGHNTATWWSNYATLVAANPKIKAVIGFQGNPGDTVVNFDKSAYPTKHGGMLAFIGTTGATAGYGAAGSTSQLKPSPPTGVAFTSAADGKSITITWAANPTGDTVTGWDVFLAPGNVTSGFVGKNSTTLPPTPRSFVVTGLTPGATYSATVVAINAAGRSVYGNVYSAITTQPGATNAAPSITSASVTVDATDTSLAHFAATATDPNADPITFFWNITGPNAFTDTKTGATASGNYAPGVYAAKLSVSDGVLVTTKTLPFSIAAGPTSTPGSHYEIPQPGVSLPEITRIYRATIPDLDVRAASLESRRSPHNALHRFAASTFDPVLASGSAKTAIAAQEVRWYWMKLEADTITGLVIYVTDAMVGTGAQLCLNAVDGSQLCNVQSGTAVDTALQTTGDTEIALDQPITDLDVGSTIAFGLFFPSGVTPPKTYAGPAQNPMGQLRLTAGFARGNSLAAQTTYPAVLPFASATPVTPAFFAVY